MYKALDVREVSKCTAGRVNNEIYGHGGSLTIKETTYVVVIAEVVIPESESTGRVRFEFCPSYKEKFLNEMRYYGYEGEYQFLIPGDKFEIKTTNTWPVVKLIKEN